MIVAMIPGPSGPLQYRQIDIIRPGGIAPDGYPMSAKMLIRKVCEERGVSVGSVLGMGRSKPFVVARAVIIHLLRDRGMSTPQIGRILGDRDHTTILWMLRRYHRTGDRRQA